MTSVEIRVQLDLGEIHDEAGLQAALNSLADVMLVQAEDGVWLYGSPDTEPGEGEPENVLVADVVHMKPSARILPTTPAAVVDMFSTFCHCPEPDLDESDTCRLCGKKWE